MKTHMNWVLLAALGIALLTTEGFSDQHAEMTPEQMQAAMDAWMKLNQPGEHHEFLHTAVGEWDIVMRSWCNGPDSPPVESAGKSVVTKILDGRFIQEKVQCVMKMPGPDGKLMEIPFEGINTMGYDNFKKAYVTTWCDNVSTSIMTMKGNRNSKTGALTLYGEMDDSMMNVHDRTIKSTYEQISPDKTIFKMYDLFIGDDFVMFEIIYERSK